MIAAGSKLSLAIRKVNDFRRRERVHSLKTSHRKQGEVVLSYMLEPFASYPGATLPHHHSNIWECRQIARTLLESGYDVDVLDSTNKYFKPKKDYAAFIEHRSVLNRVASLLNKDCVKINHIDCAHPIYNNYAEASRLLALQGRRHVTFPPRRFLSPYWAYENADYATVLGNEFTMSTYPALGKPMIRTPISVPFLYPWPEAKNVEACRRRFLWFGSGGLIHKGLDLVLEAFAEMPEMELFVCGPIDAEPEFAREYHRELRNTPNIKTIGWVDIAGPEFLALAQQCLGIVSVSCSEGGCGAVITGMHTGLVPIVNRESSVDVGEFGVMLPSSGITDIVAGIRTFSGLPTNELWERSRAAWEHVRRHHTREHFAQCYRGVIDQLLTRRNVPGRQADPAGDTMTNSLRGLAQNAGFHTARLVHGKQPDLAEPRSRLTPP